MSMMENEDDNRILDSSLISGCIAHPWRRRCSLLLSSMACEKRGSLKGGQTHKKRGFPRHSCCFSLPAPPPHTPLIPCLATSTQQPPPSASPSPPRSACREAFSGACPCREALPTGPPPRRATPPRRSAP
eukprot:6195347-Pleurochrysis_carterae.AAC.1